jgi:hypothetical protein
VHPLDDVEEKRVLGLRGGVDHPHPGVHEILRPDAVAVGEAGIGAQREAVELPVVAHRPRRGDARPRRQGDRIGGQEALVQRGEELGLERGESVQRIERDRLAAHRHDELGRLGVGGEARDRSRDERDGRHHEEHARERQDAGGHVQ